jgi:hypothetical protein
MADVQTKSIATHALTRPLRSADWERRTAEADHCTIDNIGTGCRRYYPELSSWSDSSICNAYASYWVECISDVVEPPNSREGEFLIYLFLIQYQVPDAAGDYLAKGYPLSAAALREIEALWLGEPLPWADLEGDTKNGLI